VPADWGARRAASARARGDSTSWARQLARLERDDDRDRDEECEDFLEREDRERLRDGTF
jgi:hypothetical protein